MSWLGLDIGGANVKAADGHGWARTLPFALWRDPDGLAGVIANLVAAAPDAEQVAVTMTGELCDCFCTKVEGVRHIVSAVERAAGGRTVFVYLVNGQLVSVEQSLEAPKLAAASNWHVLARFACRYLDGAAGLLIDIGSTTTDIVPLMNGLPHAAAFNDTDRLMSGELVYTGIGRTPVCAISTWLPWRKERCPVAAELFATAADAYIVLGRIAEQSDATWTADGRGLTRELARERLARMICADATAFYESDAKMAAGAIRDAQKVQLMAGVRQVVARMDHTPSRVVVSGAGEFLAAEVVQQCLPAAKLISLAAELGSAVSGAAPAHALAVIAHEVGSAAAS